MKTPCTKRKSTAAASGTSAVTAEMRTSVRKSDVCPKYFSSSTLREYSVCGFTENA